MPRTHLTSCASPVCPFIPRPARLGYSTCNLQPDPAALRIACRICLPLPHTYALHALLFPLRRRTLYGLIPAAHLPFTFCHYIYLRYHCYKDLWTHLPPTTDYLPLHTGLHYRLPAYRGPVPLPTIPTVTGPLLLPTYLPPAMPIPLCHTALPWDYDLLIPANAS